MFREDSFFLKYLYGCEIEQCDSDLEFLVKSGFYVIYLTKSRINIFRYLCVRFRNKFTLFRNSNHNVYVFFFKKISSLIFTGDYFR